MQQDIFQPTAEQTFKIVGGADPLLNFQNIVKQAVRMQHNNDFEGACALRFEAAQHLLNLLPEDEAITLEWSDDNSRAALGLLNLSAIDNFLVSDFEISSALLEMALELDPEDHLEATNMLAYNYLALGEFELFDEILADISEKSATRIVLILWSSFLRTGALDSAALTEFKGRYSAYYAEFTAEKHPADDQYLREIAAERPAAAALARELWLQTESLWSSNTEFIEALRNDK